MNATTIADLARETGSQPYEIAAFLDLGRDYIDTDVVPGYLADLVRANSAS